MLQDSELIFADPDNGISFTKTVCTKDGEKYILPEEVCEYYHGGKMWFSTAIKAGGGRKTGSRLR